MFDFLKNLLKTSNDSQIRKLQKTVEQINALEANTKKLTDDQMREKIAELRKRAQGGEALDALLALERAAGEGPAAGQQHIREAAEAYLSRLP